MMILLLSAFIATVIFLMLAFLFLHSSGEARGVKKRLGEYAGNQTKHDLSADRAEELKKNTFPSKNGCQAYQQYCCYIFLLYTVSNS